MRVRRRILPELRAAAGRDFSRLVLRLGPEVYYRLGGLQSPTFDHSRNGRPGDLVGSGHVLNVAGLLPVGGDRAMQFTSNARVRVPYAGWQSFSSFTALAVVPVSTTPGAVVSRRSDGGSPGSAAFSCRCADIVLSNSSSERSVTSVNSFAVSTPQLMVWTYDAITRVTSLSYNGVLIYCIDADMQMAAGGATPITIAALNSGGETYSNVIDETAVLPYVVGDGVAANLTRVAGLAPAAPNRTLAQLYSASTFRAALRGLGSYSGPLIDVRRGSDNATRTINTTASGDLNTADLLTWAGSASVFVSRLYDQSGAGAHFNQTTPSLQPRIVNAGVLDARGGRAVLQLTGQNLDTVVNAGFNDNDPCTVLGLFDTTSLMRGRDGFGDGWSVQMNPGGVSGCVRSSTYFPCNGPNNSNGFNVKGYMHGGNSLPNQAPFQATSQGALQRLANGTSGAPFRSSSVGWNIGNSNGVFVNGQFSAIVVWNLTSLTCEELRRVEHDLMTYHGPQSLGERIMRDRPFLYFPMQETSGTVAANLGSFAGAGTYVGALTLGAASLTADVEASVNFTATYQAVTTTATDALGNECTLELVCLGGTQIPSGFAHLLSKVIYFATTVADFPIKLGITSGEFRFDLSNGGDFVEDASLRFPYVAGQRYHIIAVYRAFGLCQLIINGAIVAEAAIGFAVSNTGASWRVGSANEGGAGAGQGTTTFIGRIAHAAVYNHALDPETARNHYRAVLARTT